MLSPHALERGPVRHSAQGQARYVQKSRGKGRKYACSRHFDQSATAALSACSTAGLSSPVKQWQTLPISTCSSGSRDWKHRAEELSCRSELGLCRVLAKPLSGTYMWNGGVPVVPGLGRGSQGPWQHRESQAADSWQKRRVSSDMCSLKLAAETSWPRAQVSLPQPPAAHQPAPHWAGALKVEGATNHPKSQQEVMGLTHGSKGKKGKCD
jgi:hypothetical protein